MVQRRSNPLDPKYQFLGATEAGENDMFGEKGCSMSKLNYKQKLEI